MAVQNLEVTKEDLLNAVAELSDEEFEQFLKDAENLRKRIAELIKKVKAIDLSPEEQKIYGKLLKKFRAENISSEEHKKLTNLTDKLEEIGAKRLEWLYEISEIRQQPVKEVMKELNIKPKNYG